MPATTPNDEWPYPLDSDPVADGATAIANLATALEHRLQHGREASVPTGGSVRVTFAYPYATNPPQVVATAGTTAPGNVAVSASGITADGFTLYVDRTDGVATTVVQWIAFGW